MPKVIGTVANLKTYVGDGTLVVFDANGVADVSDELAAIFMQVPGYTVISEQKTPENAQNEPTKEAERMTLEEFNSLSWQKQKAIVEKGVIGKEELAALLEGDYKDAVIKAIKLQLEK